MVEPPRDSAPRSTVPAPTGRTAPPELCKFVRRLADAYHRLPGRVTDEHLQALVLADAALRYCDAAADAPRPRQVAVLGPTQTGKSTLVNLLLECPATEISPLAGFTVHAQGFQVGGGGDAWTSALLPGWRRRAPSELQHNEYEAYSLSAAPTPSAPTALATGRLFGSAASMPDLPACVVWDTPDFDSLAARQYVRGVLEIIALADLYVLVLSKEKYADLSVWRLLELIEPLRRPLIICVNKLTPDAEGTVIRSLRERLAERGHAWGEVPIIPLPYDTLPLWSAGSVLATHGVRLRRTVGERLRTARGCDDRRPAGVQSLLQRHWDHWLAPVRAEHEARAEWQRLVLTAGADFMAAYLRDYLDHPQRYDSFRRAAIELLDLLEIPRVGGVIARVRQVVTWPARQLLNAGRTWWTERRGVARARPGSTVHSLGAEAAVLVDTLDVSLTGLQRDVLRRCTPDRPGGPVWASLAHRLEAEESRLRQVFETAIAAHHEKMSAELQRAANKLYAELQRQPARLAALRTARATLDVGSILLAVKTGGLTPLDAVWAPATFAVTSLLMEGFAGLELGLEARELKARQRAAVQEEFVTQTLVRELHRLAEQLDSATLLAIAPAELSAAARALTAWEVA